MTEILHPIVDLAIELLEANEAEELVLDSEAKSILLEVLGEISNEDLPITVFNLAQFAEMVRTQYQSPVGANQLLQIAETFIPALNEQASQQSTKKIDGLARRNKFMAQDMSLRPTLNDSLPKTVMSVRDAVQSWRGVIAC